jgi:hypothetical protein
MPTPNSVFTTSFIANTDAARPHVKPLPGNSGENRLGRFKALSFAAAEQGQGASLGGGGTARDCHIQCGKIKLSR